MTILPDLEKVTKAGSLDPGAIVNGNPRGTLEAIVVLLVGYGVR